jgi:hypothetical protein
LSSTEDRFLGRVDCTNCELWHTPLIELKIGWANLGRASVVSTNGKFLREKIKHFERTLPEGDGDKAVRVVMCKYAASTICYQMPTGSNTQQNPVTKEDLEIFIDDYFGGNLVFSPRSEDSAQYAEANEGAKEMNAKPAHWQLVGDTYLPWVEHPDYIALPRITFLTHSECESCVRCAFLDRSLHSRMPLDPTHVRLKLLHACDQWHFSRVFTSLTG